MGENIKGRGMKEFKLSSRSIAMALSVTAMLASQGNAYANVGVLRDMPLAKVNIQYNEIDKDIRNEFLKITNIGVIEMCSALESIVEDARGACTGSLRCALAMMSNGLLYKEDRFKDIMIDKDRVDSFALSVSGDINKARSIALIQSEDTGYVESLLDNFKNARIADLKTRGLNGEIDIVNNSLTARIGNFTAFAMNPHADKSMKVLVDGLSYLV